MIYCLISRVMSAVKGVVGFVPLNTVTPGRTLHHQLCPTGRSQFAMEQTGVVSLFSGNQVESRDDLLRIM